ncbi:2774_t:CDS:2 [Ambispora leptoticha]|uniref:2774_t:CDS:1 n=1 Tax=Ambispora leptoticha TaxID=144679 RepID=A0A9N9B713_9GLOM|nr:2774_t:CDS:2 [Ambispora leptoticha]
MSQRFKNIYQQKYRNFHNQRHHQQKKVKSNDDSSQKISTGISFSSSLTLYKEKEEQRQQNTDNGINNQSNDIHKDHLKDVQEREMTNRNNYYSNEHRLEEREKRDTKRQNNKEAVRMESKNVRFNTYTASATLTSSGSSSLLLSSASDTNMKDHFANSNDLEKQEIKEKLMLLEKTHRTKEQEIRIKKQELICKKEKLLKEEKQLMAMEDQLMLDKEIWMDLHDRFSKFELSEHQRLNKQNKEDENDHSKSTNNSIINRFDDDNNSDSISDDSSTISDLFEERKKRKRREKKSTSSPSTSLNRNIHSDNKKPKYSSLKNARPPPNSVASASIINHKPKQLTTTTQQSYNRPTRSSSANSQTQSTVILPNWASEMLAELDEPSNNTGDSRNINSITKKSPNNINGPRSFSNSISTITPSTRIPVKTNRMLTIPTPTLVKTNPILTPTPVKTNQTLTKPTPVKPNQTLTKPTPLKINPILTTTPPVKTNPILATTPHQPQPLPLFPLPPPLSIPRTGEKPVLDSKTSSPTSPTINKDSNKSSPTSPTSPAIDKDSNKSSPTSPTSPTTNKDPDTSSSILTANNELSNPITPNESTQSSNSQYESSTPKQISFANSSLSSFYSSREQPPSPLTPLPPLPLETPEKMPYRRLSWTNVSWKELQHACNAYIETISPCDLLVSAKYTWKTSIPHVESFHLTKFKEFVENKYPGLLKDIPDPHIIKLFQRFHLSKRTIINRKKRIAKSKEVLFSHLNHLNKSNNDDVNNSEGTSKSETMESNTQKSIKQADKSEDLIIISDEEEILIESSFPVTSDRQIQKRPDEMLDTTNKNTMTGATTTISSASLLFEEEDETLDGGWDFEEGEDIEEKLDPEELIDDYDEDLWV